MTDRQKVSTQKHTWSSRYLRFEGSDNNALVTCPVTCPHRNQSTSEIHDSLLPGLSVAQDFLSSGFNVKTFVSEFQVPSTATSTNRGSSPESEESLPSGIHHSDMSTSESASAPTTSCTVGRGSSSSGPTLAMSSARTSTTATCHKGAKG